jgi:pyruvate dehydrogenase E2 component (dihydrolipoamide acetyltransferase)
MPTEFRLPALGADMEEGTIVEWHVSPGSVVKRGDVVAVVETDKGAIDVEIFEDGVIRELLVQPGAKVPVGTVLALLESSTLEGPGQPEPAPSERVGTVPPPATVAVPAPVTAAATAPRPAPEPAPSLSPVPAPAPAPRTLESSTRYRPEAMREAIAAAMSRSKREIPHYYLSLATDVTGPTGWLATHNASVPVTARLLFVALLAKALALACREIQGFSGFYREGRYAESPAVHVGVAVAVRGGGLVAPAIMDTAEKSLATLMEDFRGLVTRARAGRLRASELAAPTIVLTSLGDSTVDAVLPIIQPPQVAIVGAGAVVTRPWIVDGVIAPRQVLTLSLGADHRVTDGRLGAQFLARFAQRLSTPEQL